MKPKAELESQPETGAEWPIFVKAPGNPNVSAKVYPITQRKNVMDEATGQTVERLYTLYVVDYHENGSRKRKTFAKLSDAKEHAQNAATAIAAGKVPLAEIRPELLADFMTAFDILRQGGVKKSIAAIAHETVESEKVLGGRASVLEACRDWAKRHEVELPRIAIKKAVEELDKEFKRDGKSTERIRQLKIYLDRLPQSEALEVADIDTRYVSDFLSGLDVGRRTKKNARDAVSAFLKFCARQGYLTRTAPEEIMEHVPDFNGGSEEDIEIFTVEEMTKLLSKAPKRLIPFLAIRAFAGLRGAEAQRLEWQEIDLKDGFIEVAKSKSKTKVRRIVPIRDNLRTWLKSHVKEEGRVCPYGNVTNQLMKLAKKAEVEWKHNALRHSAISYSLALSGDYTRVAFESGNSPAVIKTNYEKVVKPDAAKEWFAILPAKKAKKAKKAK